MRRRLLCVAACAGAGALLAACTAPAPHHVPNVPNVAKPAPSAVTAVPAVAHSTVAAGVPGTPAAATTPNACAHNRDRKLVLVDVSRQHLWLCQGARATFDSAVTTGAVDLPYESTPIGSFEIQEKDRNRTLTLADGQQFTVKYWIPFEGPLFGFHDAAWQTMPFGSSKYRTKGSHGCVHLPLATIRQLYAWAAVGTAVRIRR